MVAWGEEFFNLRLADHFDGVLLLGKFVAGQVDFRLTAHAKNDVRLVLEHQILKEPLLFHNVQINFLHYLNIVEENSQQWLILDDQIKATPDCFAS